MSHNFNPHYVTEQFEDILSKYTGAPYAVAVDSGSSALFLSLKYYFYVMLKTDGMEVYIPSHTYMSVPCQIKHAGGKVRFVESSNKLKGAYKLEPTPIWDSALFFTRGMYKEGQYMCLSFTGGRKPLNLGKGGAILTDDYDAYKWFKKARYHGRGGSEHLNDSFTMIGWNMYMPPNISAMGVLFLSSILERDNKEIEVEYQDLSKYSIYDD